MHILIDIDSEAAGLALDSSRIGHRECVLVGVAAGDTHLRTDLQSGLHDPSQRRLNGLRTGELDPEVAGDDAVDL